jgi:hypothetical protein
MEYSEEAYQELLKMRAHGKMLYHEERYSESLKNLAWAHRTLDKATIDKAKSAVAYFLAVAEGRLEDPNMTDTMYELWGYKNKEACDKILSEWCQRVCPEGYWMPGMK